DDLEAAVLTTDGEVELIDAVADLDLLEKPREVVREGRGAIEVRVDGIQKTVAHRRASLSVRPPGRRSSPGVPKGRVTAHGVIKRRPGRVPYGWPGPAGRCASARRSA